MGIENSLHRFATMSNTRQWVLARFGEDSTPVGNVSRLKHVGAGGIEIVGDAVDAATSPIAGQER